MRYLLKTLPLLESAMTIRSSASALVMLTLAACSSNPQRSAPVASSEVDKAVAAAPAIVENQAPKQQCKRVKPIGSHRTQLVCQTAEQSAEDARRTQDMARRNNVRNSACVNCGGGG